VAFRDGETFRLGAKEAIELYMSRKYTEDGLAALLGRFEEVGGAVSAFSERDQFGIVTKLLCLKSNAANTRSEPHPAAKTTP
jgi:hypothetical protein